MSEILFDNSEKIPEGDYLKLMNASKDVFKMAERMDRELMLRRHPMPAARAPVPAARAPMPGRAPVAEPVAEPVAPLDWPWVNVPLQVPRWVPQAPAAPPARAPQAVLDQLIRLAGESQVALRQDISRRRKVDLIPICRTMGLRYSALNRDALVADMVSWLNAQQPAAAIAAEA